MTRAKVALFTFLEIKLGSSDLEIMSHERTDSNHAQNMEIF